MNQAQFFWPFGYEKNYGITFFLRILVGSESSADNICDAYNKDL